MIKKKAKSKAATKKLARKKKSPGIRKERNPAAVRNDIAKIVESGAKKITKAVMEQAMAGQLAPARYLFEMASIYPAMADGSFSTVDEESLAATLMRRLDLPDKPIARDEEDPLKTANPGEAPTAKVSDGEKGTESGSDLGSESDSSIPAGVSAGLLQSKILTLRQDQGGLSPKGRERWCTVWRRRGGTRAAFSASLENDPMSDVVTGDTVE